ncbi:protein lifeguard 3-like [Diadema antillarum]|uniref:protein lifeguard 3-like n=1 Tax=Diadema antillarum TaxID=105358 RepID=UPI003A8565FC
MDAEYGDVSDFEFVDKEIRHGFVRKVYAILTVQLAITIGIIALFFFVEDIKSYVQYNTWVFWTAFAVSIVVIIALGCATELRRRAPLNIICLLIFTLAEGVLLGVTCTFYDGDEVILAVGMCGIITLGLTIFAFQTKIDFTMMSGLLCALGLSLLTFGLFAIIFRSEVLYTFYAALGACLFSLYIVFDTQLLLGGRHKYSVSPEEYIFAALNLYIDIINLFLFLLALFGKK